jgi:RNA polymerase sigma-70 factor, ECF subfamily
VTSVGRASGLEPLELGLDWRAEEALYRRNAGRVFGFCLSRLGRREDAEDAVQTTFLYAMRSLRRGIVPLVESAWLLGIARNVCLERWETAGRRSRLEVICDPQELDRGSAAPEGRRDELIGLEDALTRLPEQQRRAILLRDWRGLSYDEVAGQLGISHAAVETLIFRGRRTLAQLLREEPKQTRRRLASLGNLGSLLATVRTAFTGAAAATKVAAAVTVVAALAAAGSPVVGGAEEPRRVAPKPPLTTATPVSPRPAAARRHNASSVLPARNAVARRAAPAVPWQAPAPARQSDTAAKQPVDPELAPAVPTAPAPTSVAPTNEPEPVEKMVNTGLPPVPDPVTSVPLPDALAPPVTSPAVSTIVETLPTLPVDPVALVPPPPVAVPPTPPLPSLDLPLDLP